MKFSGNCKPTPKLIDCFQLSLGFKKSKLVLKITYKNTKLKQKA